jgi:hypothetical protein
MRRPSRLPAAVVPLADRVAYLEHERTALAVRRPDSAAARSTSRTQRRVAHPVARIRRGVARAGRAGGRAARAKTSTSPSSRRRGGSARCRPWPAGVAPSASRAMSRDAPEPPSNSKCVR